MQVLWREVFEGDCPFIVDEFLYCYKHYEISQSLGFYQFSDRGTDCRLIKSLLTFDKNWKMEFFFVSSFQVGNLVEVGKDAFPPYTEEIGNLCPKGMLPFYSIFSIFFVFVYPPLFLAIGRPSLSRFYLECVQQARQFADRSFHSLVTLQHLATWGLGPEMSVETLAHEFTTRRHKLFT